MALSERMATNEIVLSITKPETEWVRGRAVRKMSPTRDHSRVQTEFAIVLAVWSRGRGEVGTEWRFRVAVENEARRPLVPDISFVAFERMRGLTHDQIQAPAFAPTVAVEIRSPGDDPLDVARKLDVYLRGGSEFVLVADPIKRTMMLHDPVSVIVFAGNDVLEHQGLPGFELTVGPFFAAALDIAT